MLDFYNTGANWLARCFAVEYATWFRLILPGLARLGLVVPLGGTTLFFRRDALERLGAWDAHNVTEDADLGLRLARHGYRTELIATVTGEEANCRTWPWVRQRSRWLKGYAMTWAAHMRAPVALWRDLGTRRFVGVQVLFLGTLVQLPDGAAAVVLLAGPAGRAAPADRGCFGPVRDLAPAPDCSCSARPSTSASPIAGASARRDRGLALWAPTLHLVFPAGHDRGLEGHHRNRHPALLLGQDLARPVAAAQPRAGAIGPRRAGPALDLVAAGLAGASPPLRRLTASGSGAFDPPRVGPKPGLVGLRDVAAQRLGGGLAIAAGDRRDDTGMFVQRRGPRPSTASEVEASNAIDRCTRSSCCTRKRLWDAR